MAGWYIVLRISYETNAPHSPISAKNIRGMGMSAGTSILVVSTVGCSLAVRRNGLLFRGNVPRAQPQEPESSSSAHPVRSWRHSLHGLLLPERIAHFRSFRRICSTISANPFARAALRNFVGI
jgi:hypothetical protein